MKEGKINVQTENIFPIIKKFLYSEHEIFLRELVANATDACTKVKSLSSAGELKSEIGDLRIDITLDKDAKTLTIKDTGIGMTEDEVEKYINQIAFSGAKEFVEKFKNSDSAGIIGNFGLGFYSSFMVASKVEIITKSYKNEKAVKWTCDGSPEYTLEILDDELQRGTSIILHIADDSAEFLEESRIKGLLTKYCKFLPIEIYFKDEKINNTTPAWTKKPADLTEENYKEFYKELYPLTFEDPLFHIHLNVDYPFNLTGILYFPKLNEKFEFQKNKIQLYCRQVYVTDSVEGIMPDFLTMMHGVIDSPDIPLNVSRSYLQSDANVKKISSHITKKVADKLDELYRNNREEFEKKWDDIKIFITYGMITDEKFAEKAMKFYLLKNTEGKYFSLEEYKSKIEPFQTDKDKKTIAIYTKNETEEHAYIEDAKSKGYDVVILNTVLDAHLLGMLEQKLPDMKFTKVDSAPAEQLIDKGENSFSKLDEKQKEKLKNTFESLLDKSKFSIKLADLSEDDKPVMITQNEFMRRMSEISAVGGGMFGAMPEMYEVVVNSNHPLMSKILSTENDDLKNTLTGQAVDLALLSKNLLKGEKLTEFIKRSSELLVQS